MLNDPTLQTRGRVPAERRVYDIYGRRPDVLVLVSSRPDRFAGLYPPDRGMARHPGFTSFRLATVSRGRGVRCAYHLFVYARRRFCRYLQRLMNSAVAGLTSSGFEALRKCRPPSTTRSSAPGLLTKSFISSSALATE
jgi:hypothetical protein